MLIGNEITVAEIGARVSKVKKVVVAAVVHVRKIARKGVVFISCVLYASAKNSRGSGESLGYKMRCRKDHLRK